MSTTVVLPLVPVIAATLTPGPSNSRPRATSEITGTRRSAAACSTASRGRMPGLTTTRSAPFSTSGPAPSTPSTPSSSSAPRRRASSPASAARTSSPRASKARVAAIPDSPSPYTTVLKGSTRRLVEEEVVEEESARREGGLGDPESDHDLVLLPAQHLEVVVDGRHLEDPALPAGQPEDRVLDDDRERFDDEEPSYDRQEQLRLGQDRSSGEDAPDSERARIAHEDVRRVGVVPEKPDDGPDHRPADDRDIVLALEERDGRIDDQGDRPGPCREPVEAVRQVHGVGRAHDHEQQEEAEQRYPDYPWSEDQITVEARHHHVLGDADVAQRQDVGKDDRQGEEQELEADAQALAPFLGDLLPVVVQPDPRYRRDNQERRERRHVRPRHDQQRRHQAHQHHHPAHRRRAGFDQMRLRPFLAHELAELARLQELYVLRPEHHRYQERYGSREHDAKQGSGFLLAFGSGCRAPRPSNP